MNKITYEDDFGIYTIESKQNCDCIGQVINNLIRPVLAAAGYSEKLLDEYVPHDEELI